MSIHIDIVRINGFRGLKNCETKLTKTTVLTGMNNAGKTSFLKALQIACGNRMFINHDDFSISGTDITDKITIDIRIIPIDNDGEQQQDFDADWEILFTVDRIRTDPAGNSYVPIRSIVNYDTINNNYRTKQHILPNWPLFENSGTFWHDTPNGNEKIFSFEEIPFFYITASRDIIEDIKLKSSYLGRLISKIEYSPADVERIEQQIESLNEEAVNSSAILSDIRTTLSQLDTALDSSGEGVDITPFTKKIRDLNKGLSIYYTDADDSFAMEHHGLGTRSWSSLLTLKSFINILTARAIANDKLFFPIITIEEPEAHLHPNAQKKLFRQMDEMNGQKIISTHSTYIAGTAGLDQICNVYKNDGDSKFGRINVDSFSDEELRKIKRQVINTRGHIFFSKILIFCEGETEEQSLPIFLEKKFGKNAIELGIDIIGVGGAGGYLPFMSVAESLNIPWFIFSDAEPDTEESVRSQFDDSNCKRDIEDVVVFLDTGNKYETQLIANNYLEEIREALIAYEANKCVHPQHKEAKKAEIEGKTDDEIIRILLNAKTTMAPIIADKISQSDKGIPGKIDELFKLITGSVQLIDEEE